MRLGSFAPIFSTLFTDKMDIRRYMDVDNEDATTDTVLSSTPIYTNVPCRVSFLTEESPKDSEIDDTPVKNISKIFCKTNADVRAGDFVKISRFDDDGNVIAVYAGKLGLPSVYITHKEVLFSIEESA